MMRRGSAVAACVAMAALLASPSAHALDTRLVGSGFVSPVYATAPLADGAVFVVEKGGTVQRVVGGVASEFLRVAVETGSEQGLLGLAFDPGYGDPASAGYRRVFVQYIEAGSRDSVVASYRADAAGLRVDAATRSEVIRIDQPDAFGNHKAGWIGFRPGDADHLFVALGDGGGGNDPSNNAQTRSTLLGKMLRLDINADDFADPDINYGIPADNPFVGQAGTRGEIYLLGLRNPWRNSFDRLTGDLWVADVGQGSREEVDFIGAASGGGHNLGWRVREGDIATPGISDPPLAGLTDPVLVYDHGLGRSITGGYVVREAGSPLVGHYVFGDFVTGRIWAIAPTGGVLSMADAIDLTALLDAGAGGALGNIASFGEGARGELYIVDFGGKVVQVVPEPAAAVLLVAGLALLGLRRRPL